MKLLAAFIMRGRMQAIVVTAVAALLSLILPPLNYLSGAALALVTLRVGYRQGLVVMAGSTVAVALLGALLLQAPAVAAVFLLMLWLPLWVMAGVLRRTAQLERSLKMAAAFGLALIAGAYLTADSPAQWWQSLLTPILESSPQLTAEERETGKAALAKAAPLLTGAVSAALVLGLMGSLLIARWWQAILYNPGGFRQEFHEFRLGRTTSLLLVGLLALSELFDGWVAALSAELLIVAMLLFLIQGIALIHGLVAKTGTQPGWLIAMYALLVIALPQTGLTLALAGFVDNWFDFRNFFAKRNDRSE